MSNRQRLVDLAAEAAACRRELDILEEQLEFHREASGDAHLRALVSETPLADREADEAGRDLARIEKIREEVAARMSRVNEEIDRLLDEASAS